MCRHKTYSTNTLQSNSYKDYTSSAQSLIFNVFFFFPQGSGEQAWTFKGNGERQHFLPCLRKSMCAPGRYGYLRCLDTVSLWGQESSWTAEGAAELQTLHTDLVFTL